MSLPPGAPPPDFSRLPGLAPPPGVIPNFVDPYTRGPLFIALSGVAIGFMYLFVIARFYSKLGIHRKITWDDVTCAIATLGITGTFVGLIFLARVGAGTHQWDVRASELMKDSFLRPLYLLVNIIPLVALFTKLSFFIYYLQIFNVKATIRWGIYIGACVTTVFYIATAIALFVLTTPRSGSSLAEHFASFLRNRSSPVFSIRVAIGYFNIFSDIYILVLPISGVIRLNLAPRRKFGVILVFMTGLLACASSCAALYYGYQSNNTGDATWETMPAGYLSILEITIGINCSCVPSCFALIRHYTPLYDSFKSRFDSRVRIITARFHSSGTSSRGSRTRGFFRLRGGSKSSDGTHPAKSDGSLREGSSARKLPEISKGMYQMRTARSFIWGGKRHTTTTDEEEDGIYFAQDFQQSASKAQV